MAAPSGITWGSVINDYGRIGIYTGVSSTSTQTTVSVEVWFWSKYGLNDSSNSYYYNAGSSATTLIGSKSINHTVSSGSGWSTSNQTKLGSNSYTYNKTTSSQTKYFSAKFANIDRVGGTMHCTKSITVPALASYSIKYNANGGSGAPNSQTKWYGKSLTLSSTKPTRSGYTFQGWATSSTGSVAYNPGSSYTSNSSVTLYAVWKVITYSVKYNANGGSGAPSTQTKTHGTTLTLSSTKPTKTNYTFVGWGLTASSTTVAYAAGASYTKNAAITLYAIWKLAYTKPRITNFTVDRCDSQGNILEEGTYGLISFKWATDKTVSSIKIDHKISSGTTWTSTTVTGTGTSGTVSRVIGSGNLDIESTYNVQITVADSNGSSNITKSIAPMAYIIDIRSGGKGIAFNKPADTDDLFDVNWDAQFRKDIIMTAPQTIKAKHPVDGVYHEAFQAQNENGNTVVGFGNYTSKKGNTNIYGYNVNIAISDVPNPTVYKPYYSRGDSFNVVMRTAGYVTNSGKDVSFMITLSKPIIGAPTISATSNNGFTLRQGTKYTHGSSASVSVSPASYDAYGSYGYGIYVKASFTNTTNVTNNDAIGIYWDGRITLS